MPSHTPIPKVSTLEVIETGSRRRWTLEEKQRIVAESFSAPRVVSATARRHGLSTSQLFNWRRQAREGCLVAEEGPAFVPAVIAPESPGEPAIAEAPPPDDRPACRGSGRMVIVLSSGSRVIVGNDVDAAALRRVVDVLERRPAGQNPQGEAR
ncbi:MAG: transposase [Pseudomonadota bacterium]|nr:transposase [Pseudomonadota bacterium]